MACLTNLFSVKELEKLDEKQLRLLDEIIMREIQTSIAGIHKRLRKKLKASYYNRWVVENRARQRPVQRKRKTRRKRK
jgi:hypothetical protein